MLAGTQKVQADQLPASLHNLTRGESLCHTLLMADTFWLRLRGLLCRPELAAGSGILLLPSRSIHTVGMRHAIDVVFLDSEWQVQKVCHAVAPWQVRLGTPRTQHVVELRKGEAARAALAPGDRLQLHCNSAAAHAVLPAKSAGAVTSSRAFGVLMALLLCMQLVLCWSSRGASLQGHVDLRAYYAAGAAARTLGVGTLYNSTVEQHTQQALFHDGWRTLHFLYPPFAVLPYWALSLLSYRAALLAVSSVSLLCLLASAWLLMRQHPTPRRSPALLTVCGLLAFATVHVLQQGQVSFVLLLLLTSCYCLERRGLPVLAGLCLALCLVKVQLALPIAVVYLLWRRYRVLAGFAAGTAVLTLLSLSLVGWDGLKAYVARLLHLGSLTSFDGSAAHAEYAVHTATEPNLHGLAVALLGSGMASTLLTVSLSLLVLLWIARRPANVSTAVCAAVLLSYHLLPYDLVLLLLPLALQVLPLLRREPDGVQPDTARPRATIWLLGCSALLLSTPVAAVLLLCNATAVYALAGIALLIASQRRTPPAVEPSSGMTAQALRFAS